MNICHNQGPELQLKNSEFNVSLNVASSNLKLKYVKF